MNSQHKQTSDHDEVSKSLGLKNHLLEHYQRNGYTKLPLSPLVDDVEIDVDEVFLMPRMRVANYSQTKPASKSCQEDTIESVNGMFIKDEKAINRVCIGAKGGYGKTTLCLMIISAWTKIHTGDTKSLNRCISNSDIEFLKNFDHLFYLPLRDLNKVVEVEDMIQLHLVRESMHATLAEVLRRESKKCFILLDGLDEWSGGDSQTLPQIDRREHYSVLMTSRPYKIERVRPRVRDVEQEIEMIGLTDPNVIVTKLVAHLNRKYTKKKNYKICPCYLSYWNDTYNFDPRTDTWSRFSDVPILLSYMVCLWFDARDCGNTRLVICFNMIDMMLEVAEKKDGIESKESDSENEKLILLPNALGDLEYCKKYSNLLHSLSRLSFHTLLEKIPDAALIFPQAVCDMYGLTRIDIELCLKAALLSQSKFTGQATSKMKRLSFLHKTIQEVFAALYIANNGESNLQQFLNKYPSLEDLLEDSEILAYICGLRPEFVGQVSSHIARLADAHEKIQEYRRVFPSKWYIPNLVERIQDCVLDAIEEASLESHKINFVELHDVYDEVNFWIARKFTPSDEILQSLTFKGIKSFKCEYLGEKVFCFRNQISLPNMSLIDIQGVIEQQGIDSLGNMIERAPSLIRLKLISFNKETVNYSKLFTAVSHKNLTYLQIVDFRCDHHTKDELQSIVSYQTQLVALYIAEVYCTTCRGRRCKFELDMSYYANLKYLVLNEVTLLPKQEMTCNLERINMRKCENVDPFLRALKFSQHLIILELGQSQNKCFDIDFASPHEEPVFVTFVKLLNHTLKNMIIDDGGIKESFPSDNEDEDTSPGIQTKSEAAPSQNEVSSTQSTRNIDQDLDDTKASISAVEWNGTKHSTETGEDFETGDNQSTNEQERVEGKEHLPELPQALSDTVPTLSCLKILKVNNIDFGETLFQLSVNMTSLQAVSLYNVSISLECFEVFVESVAKFHHTVFASLGNILVHPETHESQLLVSIEQKCILLREERLQCEKPISGLKRVLFTSSRNISLEQMKAILSLANTEAREVFV